MYLISDVQDLNSKCIETKWRLSIEAQAETQTAVKHDLIMTEQDDAAPTSLDSLQIVPEQDDAGSTSFDLPQDETRTHTRDLDPQAELKRSVSISKALNFKLSLTYEFNRNVSGVMIVPLAY